MNTLIGYSNYVDLAKYSVDESSMVLNPDYSTVRVWNTAFGECMEKFTGHFNRCVYPAEFPADGSLGVTVLECITVSNLLNILMPCAQQSSP